MMSEHRPDNDTAISDTVTEEELEGRLSAHRYLLMHLLRRVAGDAEEREALQRWLDERANVTDNEEDPGAVIVPGFAEQRARADEFERMARELRSR